MNIYRYTPDSNTYHSLALDPPMPVDWPNKFKGQRFDNQWSPPTVRLDLADKLGDFMGIEAHLPVVSEKALNALRPLIAPEVEVLELKILDDVDTAYYLLNVTNVIDCLDREASDLHTFRDKILFIHHHVLNESKLEGVGIFRIKGYEVGGCYVSEKFRQIAESRNLTGLLWEPLDYWTRGGA